MSRDRPIGAILSDLAKAGLVVDQILEEVGCITGSAEDHVVEKLRQVKGVTDVSEDLKFQLPPPDSPIQ